MMACYMRLIRHNYTEGLCTLTLYCSQLQLGANANGSVYLRTDDEVGVLGGDA